MHTNRKNCLHIVQVANHAHSCPIEDTDDSRIVCIEVDPLEREISDNVMMMKWAEEAPYFIRTLQMLKVTSAIGRG